MIWTYLSINMFTWCIIPSSYFSVILFSESPSVFMVAPFTAKDLSQRSMADVIFDLQVR